MYFQLDVLSVAFIPYILFFALRQGTNFKFVRWEKYDVISTADVHFYVTLDARDPASDSVFSFQTLLCEDSSSNFPVRWNTLACRIKCKNILPFVWSFYKELIVYRKLFKGDDAVDERWDDNAVDDFYKDAMPKWLSDEELASDNKKNYVVWSFPLFESALAWEGNLSDM